MSKPVPVDFKPNVRNLSINDFGPDYVGKRYQARATDKERKKQVNKKFATIPECIAWGEVKLAEFTTGVDRAGAVLLKDVMKEWLESKDARGNDENGMREQRRLMERAIEFGISNLKSPSIIRDTQRFMKTLSGLVPIGRKKYTPDGSLVPRDYRELSAPTRRRYVMHFRDLGNFCCHASRRYLQFNPFQALEAPTLDDTIMPVFNLEECGRFVSPQALCLPEGLYWAFRLYSGMRLQECSKLRWEHVLWDQKRIWVKLEFGKKVKRNKERLLILQDELIELLRAKASVQGEFVFSDKIRLRNNNADIKAFRAHCARLGITIGDRVGHSLRGTNASILLAAGLDPIGLMDHLGHTTLSMTRKYTRASQFFRETVREWKGQLRLLPRCKESANAALGNGSQSLAIAEEPSPEDEIGECIIALLPDESPVFIESNGSMRLVARANLGSSTERCRGSSPLVRTTLEQQDLECNRDSLLRYGSD